MGKPIVIKILGDSAGFDKTMTGVESKLGGLGSGVAMGAAGVAAAGVAIVGTTFAIGQSFEGAFNTIRVGTGATGDKLKGLETSFKSVVSQTPADFGSVSAAITGVNQRLGLTGPALETLSLNLVRLSRITKTDVNENVRNATSLFNNWNVATDAQSGTLDMLFRASQQSGVSVSTLMDNMSGAGVQMRAAGFTIEQTAAMMAVLGKNGLDVSDVMPGLNKGLAVAAKNGKDAATFLQETFQSIKDAPDDTDAAGKALEVFGARGGPKLAGLIREGKLSWEDMLASISSGDTIKAAADDVSTLGGKLGKLKNQAMVALEPIATGLIDGLETGMNKVGPVISEGISKASVWAQPQLEKAKKGFGELWQGLTTGNTQVDGQKSKWAEWGANATGGAMKVKDKLGQVWDKLSAAGGPVDKLKETFGKLWENIKVFAIALYEVVRAIWDTLWSFYENLAKRINFQAIVEALMSAWGHLMDILGGIMKVLSGVFNLIRDILTGKWGKLWDDIVQILEGVWEIIWGVFQYALDALRMIWEVFKGYFSVAWDWLWSHIQNVVLGIWNGIVDGISAALGFVWNIIKTVLEAVAAFFVGIWNGLLDAVLTVWGWIVTAVEFYINLALGIIRTVLGWITGAWDSVWNGLSTTVSTIWDTIVGAIKGGINTAIGLLNGFIGFINGIEFHINIPDWVPVIGGKGFDFNGLNLPTLGYLAMGGPVGTSGLYTVGERGREDVWLPKGARVMPAHASANRSSGASITVNVQSNADPVAIGREVAWAMRTSGR